ncbi:branched-chain amino acid ABC transporter permease [Nocardioides jensenii]|uniref:branched-chain amino acid ABC transporter permease n=1 Tax=Nocardioides jensenii TaxID=1843 RepID=UPI001C3F28E0|nr:branched-chain amino acid ABC transporter permease [Nocardioides jensenii]
MAPLTLWLASSPASAADTLCLPDDKSACLAGTIRSEEDVVPDAELTVTGPKGFEESVTTSETGKWNVKVTELGAYTVTLDEESLGDDLEALDTVGKTNVAKFKTTRAVVIEVRTTNYSGETSWIEYFTKSAISGLRLGLLLALASVGLSLIYGTTGLSNFAHAEQVTMGGLLGYAVINLGGLNLWLGGLIVVIICGFTGWLQDRVMWQPLRRRGLGLIQLMIVTIGLSLALQYVFQYFVGARSVRVVKENPETFNIGFVELTYQSVAAMLISIVVLGGVGYALLYTRIGRATRAVADNPALAASSGIDVDKVIRLVWTASAALAGLSGILYALVTGNIKWDSGMQILLLLFAAVTLGGLGTAFGALVGSIIIGLVIELAPVAHVPGDFKYAAAMLILILVLMFRPQGLLGRAERVG